MSKSLEIVWGEVIHVGDVAQIPQRLDGKHTEYAHLLSSAPELLEALKELLSVSSNPLHLPATKRDAEDKARAAIAKATGESA